MSRVCSFFMMVIIVFCVSGCSNLNNNSEPQESSKTDFVVEDISDNEILYYMSFQTEAASLADQVMNAYLFRYNNGEIKDCIDRYINPEVLLHPVETDYKMDDSKLDAIHEGGALRVGIIKNGKYAFEDQSEDGTKKSAGCFDAIARLICMKLKLKSSISMYNSKDEAVSALKNNQIDTIIGIDDNTNQDLIYSFPIIQDHAVICKVSGRDGEPTQYITADQYRNIIDDSERKTKYYLIPQNSKRFSDSEESTNPAVTVTKRQA